MFVITYIIDPSNKLYYVEPYHFSTKKDSALLFKTREEAMDVQKQYPFNTEIEKFE